MGETLVPPSTTPLPSDLFPKQERGDVKKKKGKVNPILSLLSAAQYLAAKREEEG